MVSTARRRDPRDGRTLRVVDESFWAREREMLSLRLKFLHDFMNGKGLSSNVQVNAEECRYLEYQIQSIHFSLAQAGEDAAARSSLDRQVQNDASGRLDRFGDWLANNQEFKTLMLSHQTDARGDEDEVGVVSGAYKCCDLTCKHYVYGFETKEALRRHMGLHEEAEEAKRAARLQRRTSNMSLDDETVDRNKVRDREADVSSEDDDKRVLGNGSALMNANGNGHGRVQFSPFSKHSALLPNPDLDAKKKGGSGRYGVPALPPPVVRTAGPCLRCKVLKKKCDCQDPCKECPQQDVMAPDLWKALGCFHGPLTELARKCVQGFETLTASASSRSLVDTDDVFWAAEIDYLMSTDGFQKLENAFWEDRHSLSVNSANVMDKMPKQTDVDYRRLLRDYGPAVALLKTAMLDPVYLGRTAYNPFALLRVGKSASAACHDPTSWQLHSLAQTLLIAVIRYRLALATLPTSPTALANSPPILPQLMTPFTAFFRAFDTRFTNRKELSPSAWLSAFHALCLFSIAKSLLIDTPALPSRTSSAATMGYIQITAETAARLSTTHKILVSVFAWSSKLSAWCPKEPLELRDPLLRDWAADANPAVTPAVREALIETQQIVGRDAWGRAGVKHSKDFLLGLGAGSVEGGSASGFNGFLAVKYSGAGENSHRSTGNGVSGGGDHEPATQKRRIDSGVDAEDTKHTHLSDRNADRNRAASTITRRAPLPHFAPRTSTRSPERQSSIYHPSTPPGPNYRSEDSDSPQASYYRRTSSNAFLEPASSAATTTTRMPLPSVAVRATKMDEGSSTRASFVGAGAGAGGGGSGAEKRGKRRELSKEQREHAAAVRRLGACAECKMRKVKCSPTHHRGSPGSSSSAAGNGGGSVGPIVRKRKSESPAPASMGSHARRESTDEGVEGEVLVVAVEEKDE